MTRSRILTAFSALFILAAFVQPAAAHYDPKLGRWLERDPLGTRPNMPRMGSAGFSPTRQYHDGANLYQYVASRPTILVDPSGLELRFATKKDEQFFVNLANRLCPEGKWKIKDPWGKNNRRMESGVNNFCKDYEVSQGWGCQKKPPIKKKRKADSSKRPTVCGCLCDAINSKRIITLYNSTTPPGQGHSPGGYWLPPDDVYVGGGRPGGYHGTYANPADRPTNVPVGRVQATSDIIFAHELCCHAVPQTPHPSGPTRYTARDPVIQCENAIRRELGPGYGQRQ